MANLPLPLSSLQGATIQVYSSAVREQGSLLPITQLLASLLRQMIEV